MTDRADDADEDGLVRRFLRHPAGFKVRKAKTGSTLSGYAMVFRTAAQLPGYVESFAPGAFADTLASDRDVLGLYEHDPARLLGRSSSGTLRLAEDAKGLAFELDLPDTSDARDIKALAERGDLGGVSIAFAPVEEDWINPGHLQRQAVDLYDVSIIQSWPVYQVTKDDLRLRRRQAVNRWDLRRRAALAIVGKD